ncbi:host-nuclease inhibitor protein Gam [bacterium]|nr:MAG: host-nuclease inhibitor protein Gam [bacterium]
MASKTRIKTNAVQHPVPQTREEAVAAIAAIGTNQRERDRIQAAMNDELAAVRERYEAEAKPFADEIGALTKGVHLYCEAHRHELTRDGKVKSHTFASGEVKWRLRPPSVVLRGGDAVLDALKSLKLDRFIRVKEEVNKEAILAEPEAAAGVRGITIRQTEDFVVQPWDTQLEEVA